MQPLFWIGFLDWKRWLAAPKGGRELTLEVVWKTVCGRRAGFTGNSACEMVGGCWTGLGVLLGVPLGESALAKLRCSLGAGEFKSGSGNPSEVGRTMLCASNSAGGQTPGEFWLERVSGERCLERWGG